MAEVGQIIGEKYRIERLLGQGGMGAVYEAVHIHIGSKAAIKFLHPGFSENREAVQRFQREAQSAAAIGHDAIISIQDIGVTEDGSHYLVMEFLGGVSLGERLKLDGIQTFQMAAYVGCQVLSGLSAAHAVGIVHRDLKPDNIFLVDTGAILPGVKVLDFGISRVTGLALDGDEATRLTRTGVVMGTPAYMSPEHARGWSDLDQRSDLFSMGIILYELLTGICPFDGPNYNAVIAQLLTERPPPPKAHRPDLPVELEAVIQRALSKDREERYQNASEMFDDLLPFVSEAAVGRISLPSGSEPTKSLHHAMASHDALPIRSPSAGTLRAMERSGSGSGRRLQSGIIVGLLFVLVTLVGGVALALGVFGTESDANHANDRLTTPSELSIDNVSSPARVALSDSLPTKTPTPSRGSEFIQQVTIELRGLPEGATVSLEGVTVPSLPIKLARGGAM